MSRTRRRWTVMVLCAVAVAVLARLVVAVRTPGHVGDLRIYAQWAKALQGHPLGDFYQAAGHTADHLPGDLYLHRAVVAGCDLFGIEPLTRPYVLVLKLMANLADVAAAVLAWALVRRQRPDASRAAVITGVAMLLTPATIVLASAWGQWDMVSVVLFLAGTWCLTSRAWWLGPMLFGWACLIKPQIGLAAVAMFSVWLLAQPLGTAARRAVISAAVGIGAVLALCAPFSVGLPALGARWSLTERISYAGNLYRDTTLGAPNVWQVHIGLDDGTLAGLTYRTIGHLLLLACLAVLALRYVRLRHVTNWLDGGMWLAALAMWAFYICETRCHERYLVPAAALMLVHAGLTNWRRRETALAAGLAVVVAATLAVHLSPLFHLARSSMATGDRILAPINIALFLTALFLSRPSPTRLRWASGGEAGEKDLAGSGERPTTSPARVRGEFRRRRGR